MSYIDTHELTTAQSLYIKTILQKTFKERYNYSDALTGERLKKETILLPTKNNQPDWEYMENYITEKQEEAKERLQQLQSIPEKRHEIDIRNWEEYAIEDLFEIEQSKGDIQFKKCEIGTVPLVSSGNYENNGIVGYIKEGCGKAEIFSKCVITIDMFGYANYQEKDFYAVSHGRVTILKSKEKIQDGAFKFITVCLTRKFSKMCSYENMCSVTLLRQSTILLPTKNNQPDWEYMENYITQKQAEVQEKLRGLRDE